MSREKIYNPTEDQKKVLENKSKKAIVSASAGTGKTATIIEYIAKLVYDGCPINNMLVVTFTKNAANEMKERLLERLMSFEPNDYILNQIDDLFVSNISTIHSFLQKVIKQNIDKVNLSEDFMLAGDIRSAELREKAFQRAYIKACEDLNFEKLILSTRREKDLLRDVVFAIERHLSVQANPKERLDYYISNQNQIFEEAEKYLNEILIETFYSFTSRADKILKNYDENCKNFKYLINFKKQLQRVVSENSLKENIEEIKNLNFGRISSNEEILVELERLRNDVKEQREKLSRVTAQIDESTWKTNPLIPSIFEFYKIFEKELKKEKEIENIIDFDDLEKIALKLLNDDEILNDILDDFTYVFVDEYQDTNPVQERIIKTLSKNANFMAVGDPKQGIYGFRNATSEIMKKDIADFENEGSVYYLKSNFRSNKNILNFVNEVFSKVMKLQNTGVDYLSTSMFDGKTEFIDGNLPAVNIDLIEKSKETKDEAKLRYNLLEDKLVTDRSCELEAKTIVARIKQMVLSKIYDPKEKTKRDLNYSDITILVRSKGKLVSKLIEVLANERIPVISTIEKEISNCEEIDVLRNFLKICVDPNNDVALASVMMSKLFNYTADELLTLRQKEHDVSLYNQIKCDERFVSFFESIENFKTLSHVLGVKAAFEQLFLKSQYYPYLLSKKDGLNQKNQVEKFLQTIESSGYNFDIPALLSYLDSEIKVSSLRGGANAVTITTIHASKGLEYPVVIVAGLGNDIVKNRIRNFALDNDFGLGFVGIDYENNLKNLDLVYHAITTKKLRKQFVDEIMLLYVAMTRAKNHLFLTGEFDKEIESILPTEDIFSIKSFLELILSAVKEKINDKEIKIQDVKLNIISGVEDSSKIEPQKIYKIDSDCLNKISNYLNFCYPHEEATKMRYKNSVTSLNKPLEGYIYNFSGEDNLDVGNAYHKALEILNFEKINCEDDIDLPEFPGRDLIDKKLLFKNIDLIKSKVLGLRLIKEKQFTMNINSKDIHEDNIDEEIMVQGIVDLFAIGEKNILIDYKYTNISDDNKLINKYKTQLFLYKKAIENAFKIKLNEIYLLSLKHAKIIRLN